MTAAARLATVRRISVLGCPGSGKSTLSRRLARSLRLPLVHLDDLYWQDSWRRPAPQEFEARLRAALAGDSWVMDGNYAASLSLRVRSTGAVVLLDPPPWLCLARIMRRGVRRTLGWPEDLPAAVARAPRRGLVPPDPAFLRKVVTFRRTVLPGMLRELEALPPGTPCVTLRRPSEVGELAAALAALERA